MNLLWLKARRNRLNLPDNLFCRLYVQKRGSLIILSPKNATLRLTNAFISENKSKSFFFFDRLIKKVQKKFNLIQNQQKDKGRDKKVYWYRQRNKLLSIHCQLDFVEKASKHAFIRQLSKLQLFIMNKRNNIRLPPEVNRLLYVRNLPYKITSEEMYDIFGKFGAIRQIRVGNTPETRGTAFVVYEDIFDAKNACDHLSGFNVCNRYLVVLYYQSNKAFKRLDVEKKQDELNNIKTKYNLKTPEQS